MHDKTTLWTCERVLFSSSTVHVLSNMCATCSRNDQLQVCPWIVKSWVSLTAGAQTFATIHFPVSSPSYSGLCDGILADYNMCWHGIKQMTGWNLNCQRSCMPRFSSDAPIEHLSPIAMIRFPCVTNAIMSPLKPMRLNFRFILSLVRLGLKVQLLSFL